MNKKILLGLILLITLIILGIILILGLDVRYNKLVVSESKWNSIIKERTESKKISLESIKFNDYLLTIDEEDNIYYSVVDKYSKYNPLIDYSSNSKINIVIKDKLDESYLDNDKTIEIMIYNDNYYRIYKLNITSLPIISINYKNDKKNIVDINIFDNKTKDIQRVIISEGKLLVIVDNEEYIFELTKESLGKNKRENNISVLGMDKHNEFKLTKLDNIDEDLKKIKLFINNKYIGIFKIESKDDRRKENIE